MRVSAIIPAYNAVQYLNRAVESLISTEYYDLEIVLVDDGSEDSTLDVANELYHRYPHKITVFQHHEKKNRGVSASRNLGITKSTGELICFLDADDYVFPHRFKTSVPLLQKDETIDGVYELTSMVFEGKHDKHKFWNESRLFGISKEIEPENILKTLLGGTAWATSAILIRRSLLNRTGLFREDIRFAEDCHLWFRMASVGRIVAGNMKAPVSVYYRHGKNTYKNEIEKKNDLVIAMADVYKWTFDHQISKAIRKDFLVAVRIYIENGIIVAREASRPDVAWKIVFSAFTRGRLYLIADFKILRQIVALVKEKIYGQMKFT